MEQEKMMQELMYYQMKDMERRLQELETRMEQYEKLLKATPTPKEPIEKSETEESLFTRSSARERVMGVMQSKIKGAEVSVASRLEGSGICVRFPQMIDYDGLGEEVITQKERLYRCKFYYSQAYDSNNPTSWNTVNQDALNYDAYIFTMAVAPDVECVPCQEEDVDGPNLFCFMFSNEELKQLIKDTNKQPDKTGKYHFAFNIRQGGHDFKVYEVRDKEIDVTTSSNKFEMFKSHEQQKKEESLKAIKQEPEKLTPVNMVAPLAVAKPLSAPKPVKPLPKIKLPSTPKNPPF